jgi:DNA repair photolyase
MTTPKTYSGKKPIFEIPAKTVLNLHSKFKDKLLCDGPTFSLGSACKYSCAFCYVPSMMEKSPQVHDILAHENLKFSEVIIKRKNALDILRSQLYDKNGRPLHYTTLPGAVIYSSPLVDVAADMEMVQETIEACKLILSATQWEIRLLSKSNLLPKIADAFAGNKEATQRRIIYGVSTGTLDDNLAKSFEQGTPLPSKRIASLHQLQDRKLRTFGMICPSLPQKDYEAFSQQALEAIRADRCEHVWAEVINLRGESLSRTIEGLTAGGYFQEAKALHKVSTDSAAWEEYARATFLAHQKHLPAEKLRFLQYTTRASHPWWQNHIGKGAILLGAIAEAHHTANTV